MPPKRPFSGRRRSKTATDKGRSAAGAAYRSQRRDPSEPEQSRRPAAPERASRRAPGLAVLPPPMVLARRRGERRLAQHCRRPARRVGQRRSPQLLPRCNRRSRAMRAKPRLLQEKPHRACRLRCARRHGDYERAHNSRGLARAAGCRRARPRRAPKYPANASRTGQNRDRLSQRWSAAA